MRFSALIKTEKTPILSPINSTLSVAGRQSRQPRKNPRTAAEIPPDRYLISGYSCSTSSSSSEGDKATVHNGIRAAIWRIGSVARATGPSARPSHSTRAARVVNQRQALAGDDLRGGRAGTRVRRRRVINSVGGGFGGPSWTAVATLGVSNCGGVLAERG